MEAPTHQDLVKVITGVHMKLRKELFKNGDINKVWEEHIADESLRKDYSRAMLKLATQIWNEKESRINWSYNICIDYFFNGGLNRSLLREIKIKKMESISISNQNYLNRSIEQKLQLLDVGSCFNPFSKFDEFSCTAIDLTPATTDVLQCDFLSLKLSKNSDDPFHEESFDVVVMSLVLEYLPCPMQRALFCIKAHQLLKEAGLCIIITPDSKSVHHNAPMMKSWKLGMEKIGFVRVKYDKLTHLHCMAFRKSSKDICTTVDSVSTLFYIPQDFHMYAETVSSSERTEEENDNVCEHFLELPYV